MEGITMAQKGIKKMRAVLMDFARKRGLDPLRAKTWRTISKFSLREEKVIFKSLFIFLKNGGKKWRETK
jgi:hypothetical protein